MTDQEHGIIHKPAANDHPLHDLLKQRWSSRAFAETPVERETLLSLFEAVRWSPSSFNAQSWRLIVATQQDAAAFDRLLGCINEGNQAWAKFAPVLMLTLARTTFEADGSVNRHAWYDVGLAVANMTVQATAMGLRLRQMAGVQAEHARTEYAIPAEYDVVTAVALGYPGTTERLLEKHQQRELEARTRKGMDEFVFDAGGAWAAPSPLLVEPGRGNASPRRASPNDLVGMN
jgi:nitroreductase